MDKLKTTTSDSNNFKSHIDKLDVTKLETVPVDLKKLIDVPKIMLLKKNCLINQAQNLHDQRLKFLV